MKRYVSRIAILALLVCGACHSSDQYLDQDCQDKSRLAVSAVMEGSEEATGSSDYYKHDRFILNRSIIRVVNTVNYSVPDFKNGEYYDYIYTLEDIDWDDNRPNFRPLKAGTVFGDENRVDPEGGFDGDRIVPTSNAFIFEAACYPMKYVPFDAVATDQSDVEGFWSADLLLAHTRKPLNERYELLKLKFWHVFSMIRIELELPVAESNADSGFPEGTDNDKTVKSISLTGMYVTYNVRYAESIESNASRTVVGTSDGGRQNISMYRLPDEDKVTEKNGRRYLNCVFAAIVPTQQIRTQETLLELCINTIVGVNKDMSKKIEKRTYVFQPKTAIDMRQGYITVLKLTADEKSLNPVLLSAKVNPWSEAYTEVDLTPVSSSNP